MLARKALNHISHTPSLFCFGYFSGKVLFFAYAGLFCNSPPYASPVAVMTGTENTSSFFIEMESQ
jgi:hypothetical protein